MRDELSRSQRNPVHNGVLYRKRTDAGPPRGGSPETPQIQRSAPSRRREGGGARQWPPPTAFAEQPPSPVGRAGPTPGRVPVLCPSHATMDGGGGGGTAEAGTREGGPGACGVGHRHLHRHMRRQVRGRTRGPMRSEAQWAYGGTPCEGAWNCCGTWHAAQSSTPSQHARDTTDAVGGGNGPKRGIQERLQRRLQAVRTAVGRRCPAGAKRLEGQGGRKEAVGGGVCPAKEAPSVRTVLPLHSARMARLSDASYAVRAH